MKKANYFYLHQLLAPLNTLSREEERIVQAVDPNSESDVRAIIKRFIKPFLEALTTTSQEQIKDSFSYFLTTEDAPFLRILKSQQESPLELPDEAMLFFVWVWKELFPNENHMN